MSNETVTYSLESILKEIKDSIKDVNQKFDSLQKNLNQKFDKIDERLTKLEVGQAKLTEKVDGMDRRLGNEYIRFHGKEKNLEKLLKFVRKQINQKYNWKEVKNIAEFDKKSDFKNVLLFLGNKEKYRNELIVTTRAIEFSSNKINMIISDSEELKNKFSVPQDKFGLIFLVQPNFYKENKKEIQINKINLNLIDNFHVVPLARLITSYLKNPFSSLTDNDSQKILVPAFNSLIVVLDKTKGSINSEILESLKDFGDQNRASFLSFYAYLGEKSLKYIVNFVPLNRTELPCAILISGINNKTDIINKYKFNSSSDHSPNILCLLSLDLIKKSLLCSSLILFRKSCRCFFLKKGVSEGKVEIHLYFLLFSLIHFIALRTPPNGPKFFL